MFSEKYISMRYLRVPKMLAYIHIPKTGGTYLGQIESEKVPVVSPLRYFGHSYVIDKKSDRNVIYLQHDPERAEYMVIPRRKVKQYFVFSTVRNIFDWLVSYAAHAGGWHPGYHDPGHYDFINVHRGFEYLVKTIMNRKQQWPCRKFIYCQLFSSRGDLVVDWINRTETLDGDLEKMARHKKLHYQKRHRQRVDKRKDYRSYYNDTLIELVNQTWGRELELFGYDFDGLDISSALLKKHVYKETKKKIKYCWALDKLFINGEERK